MKTDRMNEDRSRRLNLISLKNLNSKFLKILSIISLLLALFFVFNSASVSAYSITQGQISFNYSLVEVSGREYTPNCFECDLPVNVTYVDAPNKKVPLPIKRLTNGYFKMKSKNDDIGLDYVEIRYNKTYKEKVYDYGYANYSEGDASVAAVNSTIINVTITDYMGNYSYLAYENGLINKNVRYKYDTWNSTYWKGWRWEVVGSHKEERWKWAWRKPEPNEKLYLGNSVILNFHGSRSPTTEERHADFVPYANIRGSLLNFSELAWWNASFSYRYPISNIQNDTVQEAISVNDNETVNGSVIWAYINNESYIYSTESGPSGQIVIANRTTEKFWENESSLTGNQPTKVWNQSGEVGVWHFGSSSLVGNDSSPYGNDGTLGSSSGSDSSDPKWTTDCISGSCLEFDGVDDYVNVSDDDSLANSYSQLSISFWFKSNIAHASGVNDVDDMPIDKWGGASAKDFLFKVWEDSTDSMQFYLGDGGGTEDGINSNLNSITANKWYHVVGTYDGTMISLYVNGDLDNNETTSLSLGNGGSDFYIGGYLSDGSYSKGFNGTIDEVRIYDRALSEEEIKRQYWNGVNNLTSIGTEEYNKVNLISPPDGSAPEGLTQTFTCNSTMPQELANISLYHNVTGTWHLNQTNDVSGTQNETSFSVTVGSETNLIWNCEAEDVNGNTVFADNNWTVTISPDTTPPTINYLTIHRKGTTWLKWNWSVSDASPPITYEIKVEETGSGDVWVDWKDIGSNTTYTAENLYDNTEYTIFLNATDSYGNENSTNSSDLTLITGLTEEEQKNLYMGYSKDIDMVLSQVFTAVFLMLIGFGGLFLGFKRKAVFWYVLATILFAVNTAYGMSIPFNTAGGTIIGSSANYVITGVSLIFMVFSLSFSIKSSLEFFGRQ